MKIKGKLQLLLLVITSLFLTVCLANANKQANAQPNHAAPQANQANANSPANQNAQFKLLAFSGSIRGESINKKALALLIDSLKKQGAEVTYISLSDFNMPLYNGDLEDKKGIPDTAKKLQDLISSHDGLIIASPEYNGLPSPLLINTIDWASREVKGKDNSGTKIFQGKPATLIAASPGKMGGSRGLTVLTQFLSNIGVKVAPQATTIPNAMQAFDAKGQLTDQALSNQINNQAKSFIQMVAKNKQK